MRRTQAEWDHRIRIGLAVFEASPELRRELNERVDAFYARHPGLARTRDGEGYVAGLFCEQIAEEGEKKTTTSVEEKAA